MFLVLGTGLDVYLNRKRRNKINGFMFDNYKYVVNGEKSQTLSSEHSKIDMQSGKEKSLNLIF